MGHFSGAGATGKPHSSRMCQSLLVDCTFPLEPLGSPVVMRLTHDTQTSCDVRVDSPYEPRALWGSAPHCNLSLHCLVLERIGTNACTWLLLVHCSHIQIDFSVPCRMLKMWPCNFSSCSGSFSPAPWLYFCLWVSRSGSGFEGLIPGAPRICCLPGMTHHVVSSLPQTSSGEMDLWLLQPKTGAPPAPELLFYLVIHSFREERSPSLRNRETKHISV